ncbi:hypothetical protein CQ14_31960 [Bradyrhizobium lablabi]|uniref:Uncharacterized protein n=1 Tax=Bradyrhizobium lablabi TaxID=722472 RepID=A0A0R3NDC9_9BRAD|nr:hypothetical protein CQ14_31960 [Bradyrhizobium lablabi]
MVTPAKSWKPSLVSSPHVILLISTTILSSAAACDQASNIAASMAAISFDMHIPETPASPCKERGRHGGDGLLASLWGERLAGVGGRRLLELCRAKPGGVDLDQWIECQPVGLMSTEPCQRRLFGTAAA